MSIEQRRAIQRVGRLLFDDRDELKSERPVVDSIAEESLGPDAKGRQGDIGE